MLRVAGMSSSAATAEAQSDTFDESGATKAASEGADVDVRVDDMAGSVHVDLTEDAEESAHGGSVIGSVDGRPCLLIDDLIDSARPFGTSRRRWSPHEPLLRLGSTNHHCPAHALSHPGLLCRPTLRALRVCGPDAAKPVSRFGASQCKRQSC